MKRTRWNKRKFLRNVAQAVAILIFSSVMALGLIVGFEHELDVQAKQYENFIK